MVNNLPIIGDVKFPRRYFQSIKWNVLPLDTTLFLYPLVDFLFLTDPFPATTFFFLASGRSFLPTLVVGTSLRPAFPRP